MIRGSTSYQKRMKVYFLALNYPHSIKFVLKTDQLNHDYGPSDCDSTYIIYYILRSFWISFKAFLKKHRVFIMLPLYAWGCSYVMLGRGYKRIFCAKEEILFSELADWLVINALPLNMRKMFFFAFWNTSLTSTILPMQPENNNFGSLSPFFIRKAKLNSKVTKRIIGEAYL